MVNGEAPRSQKCSHVGNLDSDCQEMTPQYWDTQAQQDRRAAARSMPKCGHKDCRNTGPGGMSISHPTLKPSWLVCLRAALQGNTGSALAKKEARLSCSSQPPAAFAPLSRKGCWDANKVFSNRFWPSSRTIHLSLTATTRSRNLYFEEYQPVPLPPGTSELRHCKAASRKALLYGQPSSGPVLSCGEMLCSSHHLPGHPKSATFPLSLYSKEMFNLFSSCPSSCNLSIGQAKPRSHIVK